MSYTSIDGVCKNSTDNPGEGIAYGWCRVTDEHCPFVNMPGKAPTYCKFFDLKQLEREK